MLRKMYLRKIMVATVALVLLGLLYFMPGGSPSQYDIPSTEVIYQYSNQKLAVYLFDKNNYVSRVVVPFGSSSFEKRLGDIFGFLIVDGEKSNLIPNGFCSVLPKGTKVLSTQLDNKILTVNFSNELMKIDKSLAEKMVEALIYSLTELDGVLGITIQVEGKNLEVIPYSQKQLPLVLDRSFGINKIYDLVSPQNVESCTVYYVGADLDLEYYVPITKYVNGKTEEKIRTIIRELSASPITETNLKSYLDTNVSLIDYSISEDQVRLIFNDAIFYNQERKILEEVLYTISFSVLDNFSTREVVFLVNNEEIYKNSSKMLE